MSSSSIGSYFYRPLFRFRFSFRLRLQFHTSSVTPKFFCNSEKNRFHGIWASSDEINNWQVKYVHFIFRWTQSMMSDVGGSSGNASDFRSGRPGFESLLPFLSFNFIPIFSQTFALFRGVSTFRNLVTSCTNQLLSDDLRIDFYCRLKMGKWGWLLRGGLG